MFMKKARAGSSIKYLILVFVSLIMLFPLYLMVTMSFKDPLEIFADKYLFPSLHPTFRNFAEILKAAPFFTYLKNTVLVVTGILSVQLLLIIPAAYVFARFKFRFSGALFLLYMVQIMLPLEALIVPNYRIMGSFGLLNTRIAMVLPFIASGFCAFLLRQAFKQIPQSLEDAAIIDGCSHFRFIWNVLLPLAKPTITVFSLISVATHWNAYMWPLVVTDSDSVRTLTIGLGMFVQQESGADWGMLMAATLFITLPIIVLFLVLQRAFIESFMTSGMKG